MSGEGTAAVTQSAGTLPSLATLRTRVYAPLRDSERSFVETWYVDQLLNEAYIDLNARLRIKQVSLSSTATAGGVVAFPADMVEVISLWFGDTQAAFVDDATYDYYVNNSLDTGSVIYAHVFGTDISTYPVQASAAYVLNYVARPTEMVGETDTPSDLTFELVPRIVNYARAYAKWQEGEFEEGNQFMALYEQGLPGSPRNAYRYRPGSPTLIPEQGPFDA